MDEFAPLARTGEAYDFVFVGELRRLKGLDTLLDALLLLREHYTFQILLVGGGPQHASYLQKIRRHDLETSIDISPPVYPSRLAFARARCVVVPSLMESFPYVVLEAAAAGRPMIASNAGGIGEILGPLAGSLIAVGDPRALADAMAAFLDDPSGAAQVASELQNYVERQFRADQMAWETADFYREMGRIPS